MSTKIPVINMSPSTALEDEYYLETFLAAHRQPPLPPPTFIDFDCPDKLALTPVQPSSPINYIELHNNTTGAQGVYEAQGQLYDINDYCSDLRPDQHGSPFQRRVHKLRCLLSRALQAFGGAYKEACEDRRPTNLDITLHERTTASIHEGNKFLCVPEVVERALTVGREQLSALLQDNIDAIATSTDLHATAPYTTDARTIHAGELVGTFFSLTRRVFVALEWRRDVCTSTLPSHMQPAVVGRMEAVANRRSPISEPLQEFGYGCNLQNDSRNLFYSAVEDTGCGKWEKVDEINKLVNELSNRIENLDNTCLEMEELVQKHHRFVINYGMEKIDTGDTVLWMDDNMKADINSGLGRGDNEEQKWQYSRSWLPVVGVSILGCFFFIRAVLGIL